MRLCQKSAHFSLEVTILRNTHSDSKEPSRLIEDIPIARRDRFRPDVTTLTNLRQQRKTLTRGLFFALGIALVSTVLAVSAFLFRDTDNIATQGAAVPKVSTAVDKSADSLLGHLRYPEAPAKELKQVDGGLKLRSTALPQFQAMTAAAKAAGVKLTTISAFRSIADQEKIFFKIKAQRKQAPQKRAEVSAPPRFSEHHTGYAVDLGDATNSTTDLNPEFDTTPAFKWLQANAARYSFEMSFPQGNLQGVSYEPWHWRYVGDSDSLETFYRARKTQTASQPKS
jgi:zinc D-Ala-D-Ala carboxypeptidase